MTPSKHDLRVTRQGSYKVLEFTNSKTLNALTPATLKELKTALSKAEKEKTIKAIIIKGNDNFCAGADLNELKKLTPAKAKTLSRLGQEAFFKIENCAKPVLALITGYCVGGGNELAMSCHYRFSSPDAVFSQPEARLGLIPGFGGTYRLPRLVGWENAKRLISTGEKITASHALRIGLIDEVHEKKDLMKESSIFLGHAIENHELARIKKYTAVPKKEQEKLIKIEATEFSERFKTGLPQKLISEFLEKKKKARK